MNQERDIQRVRPAQAAGARRVFPGAGPRDDAHAVVIGINRYVDQRIPDLNFARADAESMYDVLIDPRYGRFKPDNVTLLLDEDATQKKIRSAIGTHLPRRAARDHTVCLYFAGHGAPVIDPRAKSLDGLEKYLVPHDAEADDLRATGIPMDEVQQFFEWIDTSQLILFLDSCYSGGAAGPGGRSFHYGDVTTRATLTDDFLEVLSGDGRMVVTACNTNEVSLESPALGHGVFTYHLVEGLKGAADTGGDGLVTLDELYEYVYKQVERQARSLGGSMNPIRKGFVQGSVYLSCYETPQQLRLRELVPAAETALQAGNLMEAGRLWQEVAALVADDPHAQARLALVAERSADEERRREEEARRRVEELTHKQQALLEFRRAGTLPARFYARALDLVERDLPSLDETDTLLRELTDELILQHLTPAQYIRSVELALNPKAPPVRAQEPAAPAPLGPVQSALSELAATVVPAAPSVVPNAAALAGAAEAPVYMEERITTTLLATPNQLALTVSSALAAALLIWICNVLYWRGLAFPTLSAAALFTIILSFRLRAERARAARGWLATLLTLATVVGGTILAIMPLVASRRAWHDPADDAGAWMFAGLITVLSLRRSRTRPAEQNARMGLLIGAIVGGVWGAIILQDQSASVLPPRSYFLLTMAHGATVGTFIGYMSSAEAGTPGLLRRLRYILAALIAAALLATGIGGYLLLAG